MEMLDSLPTTTSTSHPELLEILQRPPGAVDRYTNTTTTTASPSLYSSPARCSVVLTRPPQQPHAIVFFARTSISHLPRPQSHPPPNAYSFSTP